MVSKYIAEERHAAVERVVSGESSTSQAARDIGIHKSEMQKWVAAYRQHGVSGVIRERAVYTGGFKQTVVEDMLTNNMSFRETAAKYNISDHGVVSS